MQKSYGNLFISYEAFLHPSIVVTLTADLLVSKGPHDLHMQKNIFTEYKDSTIFVIETQAWMIQADGVQILLVRLERQHKKSNILTDRTPNNESLHLECCHVGEL